MQNYRYYNVGKVIHLTVYLLSTEEKIDEHSHSASSFKVLPFRSDMRTNLEEQTLDTLNELMSESYYMDISKSMAPSNDNICSKACNVDTLVEVHSSKDLFSRPSKASKHEEEEIERILNLSALYLSNGRPDPSFVVYAHATYPSRGKDSTLYPSDVNTPGESNEKYHESNEPLFDGAIAHSTPGSGHEGDSSTGGGVGTILHLACILDAPFSLAILIAMQGDLSSRYSAFRRTAIHEAACSDSCNCLQLLIDLSMQIHNENHPYSENQHSVRAKSPLFGNSLRTDYLRGKQNNSKMSFTSTLQHIHHLWTQIQMGVITELDASLNLLRQVPLSHANQSTLVESFADILGVIQPHSTAVDVVSARISSPSVDGHGNSALHWAAFKNSKKCLSLLLRLGIDPNIKSEISGWTPLHDAAYSNSFECVEMLIKAGADMNKMAHSGATPLCFASQENASDAIRILLKEGADATIQSSGNILTLPTINFGVTIPANRFSGYTALHYAAHYNSEKAAKTLLENNPPHLGYNLLEIPDSNDKLPIHIAVQRGSSDVLRELLHSGARVLTVESPLKRGLQSPRSTPSYTSPVSSPILRSMIPSRPISSSKPWNCLSQRSIDECRLLIDDVERNWSPRYEL